MLVSVTLTVNLHIHHMKQLKYQDCLYRSQVVTFAYYAPIIPEITTINDSSFCFFPPTYLEYMSAFI